mgnify:FL=1
MENNKTMVLSILGVLVLVIAVVGVSFAMYTFSATGTRENTISTGSVSLTFSADQQQLFALDNEYIKTDAQGLASEGKSFSLTSALNGTMNVAYEIGFTEVTQDNTNLTDSLVMVNIKDNNDNYLMGSASAGATINSVKANVGFDQTAIDNMITGNAAASTGKVLANSFLLNEYVFDKGTINGTTGVNKTYTIKAWISDQYQLKGGEASTANKTYCTVNGAVDSSKDTAEACKAADGTWTQEKATTAETFSFKIKVSATQV